MMSVIAVPLSSSSTGTVQSGFRARNAGVSCSPLSKSTCMVGTVRPFSARKMRTRRGLGAVYAVVKFHEGLLAVERAAVDNRVNAVDCCIARALLPKDHTACEQ